MIYPTISSFLVAASSRLGVGELLLVGEKWRGGK
jgi:hypothetical protein